MPPQATPFTEARFVEHRIQKGVCTPVLRRKLKPSAAG